MRFEIILEIQKYIFSIPFSCSIRRKITRVEFHHFDKIKHTFCRDREAIFSSCLEEEEEEKIGNQKLLFTHSKRFGCLITQGKKVRVTRCTRANKRKQHSPLISPPIFKSFLFGLRIRLILPRAISTTKLSLQTTREQVSSRFRIEPTCIEIKSANHGIGSILNARLSSCIGYRMQHRPVDSFRR